MSLTRRGFLSTSARAGLATLASQVLPGPGWLFRPRRALASTFVLDEVTLAAALRRMIPAGGAGDWDAVDAGALKYVKRLLSSDLDTGGVYAGGPTRADFAPLRMPSAVKREGWKLEVERLRAVYAAGLADLNDRAGGDFPSLPAEVQDAILTSLDLEGGSEFFRVLYHHTMEG
ncbi:MAG: gluconate 2-dehydrogenase subunit 3 family protein, partial [Candidatus Binatia bacterium]